jgi:hypothetical protein
MSTTALQPILDGIEPWSKQAGESRQAWEAWLVFRDLGFHATNAEVSRRLSKSIALINRWSSRWGWRARMSAWLQHVDQDREEKAKADILAMRTRYADAGRYKAELGVRALVIHSKKLALEEAKKIEEANPMPLYIASQLVDSGAALEFKARLVDRNVAAASAQVMLVNSAGQKEPLTREEFMRKMKEIYGVYEDETGTTGTLFHTDN